MHQSDATCHRVGCLFEVMGDSPNILPTNYQALTWTKISFRMFLIKGTPIITELLSEKFLAPVEGLDDPSRKIRDNLIACDNFLNNYLACRKLNH